jgi:hypothetical protein
MHDIDRVLLESPQVSEGEEEQFLFEDELEQEGEFEDELEHEHSLSETQEVELANQVLESTSEHELEQFVADLMRSVGDPAGRFARSKTGRHLAGMLKQAATQALPVVGAAHGPSWQDSARCFGLDPETISSEDEEFQLGRNFVRFAECAARQAQRRFNSAPPQQVARQAISTAARLHAPGLPVRRVVGAAPVRRPTVVAATGPATQRPATNGRRVSKQTAGSGRSSVHCQSCGSPLTATRGRWVLRGNAVVLLPD